LGSAVLDQDGSNVTDLVTALDEHQSAKYSRALLLVNVYTALLRPGSLNLSEI